MYSGIFKFLCFKFKCKENKNCSKSMCIMHFWVAFGQITQMDLRWVKLRLMYDQHVNTYLEKKIHYNILT